MQRAKLQFAFMTTTMEPELYEVSLVLAHFELKQLENCFFFFSAAPDTCDA